MTRRKSVNQTGISHIPDVPSNDIWISYTCMECGRVNHENIGVHLLPPGKAYEQCEWKCPHCGFMHSKNSDLPERLTNWNNSLRNHENIACQRFWKAFFNQATADQESYWKQCTTCGRVLPASAFAKHAGWSEIEKQQECKACKAAINSLLNDRRTKEQLQESSARRRIGDLMHPDRNYKPYCDIKDLFRRFGGKCFKTGKPLDIKDRKSWHIDHILPSSYFYPLTKENAALLSAGANGSKRAQWPSEVYTNAQLVELARITGADLGLLSRQEPVYNTDIDPDMAVERYLYNTRSQADLSKKIKELVKVLSDAGLTDRLSEKNKRVLGLSRQPTP